MTTLKQTPLNAAHRAMGAKMVDFGGWDMPVNYGSQIDEHHQVRRDCGMFDVCHMRVVDAKGDGVRAFLRYLLANNADKLHAHGRALYSAMLRPDGHVIDDLIIYFMSEQWFRIVVNAGTADKDIAWMKEQAETFHRHRPNGDATVALSPSGGKLDRGTLENPLPSPDGTTSHSTRLANDASQVAGYPPARGRECCSVFMTQ
jgi:aminomethyltransferase